ncbi:uncharacterized protein LOC143294318 [Babylonia areolata]|uniref:uncharacterized protein LOC143294318 n=1 Tax=Babylonia areolata TaxID=304850 RepID=UPI003FD6B51F
MENVIKQGYLKKGNSVEGGVFSGIIEKITPRKWYVLVVRNRVPFLEQYERDVDVFSGGSSVSYDLSVCTSISRTMSTKAKNFPFTIVCPDELIELIPPDREHMVDWCNTLERTLNSLGILRNEQSEHIYTVCPAVVNVVGRSTIRMDEDDSEENNQLPDEEELGAVGGAPAFQAPPVPLPPRPQVPPPLPASLPPVPVPRMLSEPAAGSVPPTLPPPLQKGGGRSKSPSEMGSCSSAPPSPHVSVPLSPPPASGPRPSSIPPPLPRWRPPNRNASAADKPPPLPPGRPGAVAIGSSSVQERSLPPVPPLSPPTDASSATTEATRNNSSDSEDEDSYSSDFISGAFWDINRKTPVPSARFAVLPPKSGVSSSGASGGAGVSREMGGDISVELDDGYSDLNTVWSARKTADRPQQNENAENTEYTKVNKKSVPRVALTPAAGKDSVAESTGSSGPSTPLSGGESDLTPLSVSGLHHSDLGGPEAVSSSTASENDQDGIEDAGNFYAPFPAHSADDAMTSSKESENCDGDDDGDKDLLHDVTVIKITSTSGQNRPAAELPPVPDDSNDAVMDCMYASAADASTLFATDSVPPLPPRQDSLSQWKGDSSGEGSPNHTAAAASPVTENSTYRPIPRRRTVRTSQPVTKAEQDEQFPNSVMLPDIPPLPPPRRGGQSQTTDSISQPPPLPARMTQSVRGQRPMSMVASFTSATESEDPLPASMSESFCGSTSLTRQQSFGNGDSSATENHLRQRMRLDRTHSMQSVISLKKSQADILRQEMDLPGVTVTVSLRASQGIALVDCADAVCIVGWNQKDFPSLHGKFHIGDQLISVCNVKITSATMAQKMLKHPPVDLVEMLVKRTPHARVLAIRRVAEGQSIGIKRNGGTAEILYVDPNGLAAENGLPLHAAGVQSSPSRVNWVLTEINSRHLNLFFKDNEIEHRLNAVGREITIVVQPSDYITELKKQLKKIKNYKNYIVQ